MIRNTRTNLTAEGPLPAPDSFQTTRMRATRLSATDLPTLLELHRDERVMEGLGGCRDEQETARYLERNLDHWADHGFGVWMLRDAEGTHPIGRVILRWLSSGALHEVEIGFALFPAYWGLGLASEAARYCVDIARRELALETLIGVTLPDNRASQRVLARLGFQYESLLVLESTECHLYRVRWPANAD